MDGLIFKDSFEINRRFLSNGLIFREIMDFSENKGLQSFLKFLRKFSGGKSERYEFCAPGRQAPLRKNSPRAGEARPRI